MKYILFSLFSLSLLQAWAQDTTWVQTFTFDSITTRRANFQFPASLDTERFEKVLMYYKLKCSPLTTWDQYDCGEWDYLTYTRVFDHTGAFDSVAVNGQMYLSNCTSPALIQLKPLPYTEADLFAQQESVRQGLNLTYFALNNGTQASNAPFQTNRKGSKFQFVLTAAELTAAGLQAGPISSLKLNLASTGELWQPKISLASYTGGSLNAIYEGPFTEVYQASRTGANALQAGWNPFVFYQDFLWDGSSDILVDFSFSHDFEAAQGLSFLMENTAAPAALAYSSRNGTLAFDGSNYTISSLANQEIGGQFTIEFWAKGAGNAGLNSTFIEALDSANRRVLNIHLPWSNNNIYFDAGDETGYDRINKAATPAELDNTWTHWAFVKDQSSGQMFIYQNGQLWHSGTNKTREMGYIQRMVIGFSNNQNLGWKGNIDELRVFNTALSASTILTHYTAKVDNTHPNWSDLLFYHDFDELKYAKDLSTHNELLMPSSFGLIQNNSAYLAGVEALNQRPLIQLGQGACSAVQPVLHTRPQLKEPTVVFKQVPLHRHFELTQTWVGVAAGQTQNVDLNGQVTASTPIQTTLSLANQAIVVYNPPFEIIHDVELARYITPYGIQFDLGPNGFTWIYDVTDYQQYLQGLVDLAAHNTQELIDLKFAFVKGIPPRDLISRAPIWSDFKSYNYGQMAADIVLPEKAVVLSDTAEMFKIKTRMSGHGQVGDAACCEWVNNSHQIKVDGVPRFNWSIWDAMVCGDNPNIGQGGTWPYAREGWCPGDLVKEFEFELTPYVQPGDTVLLDYVINDVPAIDPGQAGGNYIAAYDLISYGAPNFAYDAAIVDVLNPNNYEYYAKWNPTCQNPRIILKNTGAQALTSCQIVCWLDQGANLTYNWTGNLAFLEETIVEIPVTDLNWWYEQDSSFTFTAQVIDVNGHAGPDLYTFNSQKTVKYDAPERIDGPFFIWLTTNNKATENSYQLLDHAGTVLFERSNLQNTTQYKDTFDLAPGCYSIIIEDTDHDGLAFWYSAQVEGETSGQMRLRKVGGSYIEFFPGDFGRYHRYDFTVGFTLDAQELESEAEISIFPNPASHIATIEISGQVLGAAALQILDLSGRVLHQETMAATASFAESFIDMSSFAPGTYIVAIQAAGRTYTSTLMRR